MYKEMAVAIMLSCACGTAAAGYGFEPVAALAPRAVGASDLAVGDVVGDARDDVVVLAAGSHPFFTGKLVVYRQIDGGFAAPVTYAYGAVETYPTGVGLKLGDLDSDGDLDVVLSRGSYASAALVVMRNDGGNFVATAFPVSDRLVQIELDDVDQDGHLDVVGRRTFGAGASILHGDGSGGFGSEGLLPFNSENLPFHLVDVDGDDRRDLVFRGYGSISMKRHEGSSYAALPRELVRTRPYFAGPLAVADFDGDGRTDLLTSTGNWQASALLLYPQSRDGVFRLKRAIAKTSVPTQIEAHDVDGDGRIDIGLLGQAYEGGFGLVRSRVGGFEPLAQFITGPASRFGMGDVNDDGVTDVVLLEDGAVSYLLGRGSAMEGDLAVYMGLNSGAAVVRVVNESPLLRTGPYQLVLRVHARTGDINGIQFPPACYSYTNQGVMHATCQMPALAPGAHAESTFGFGISAEGHNRLSARARVVPQLRDLRTDNNLVNKQVLVPASD